MRRRDHGRRAADELAHRGGGQPQDAHRLVRDGREQGHQDAAAAAKGGVAAEGDGRQAGARGRGRRGGGGGVSRAVACGVRECVVFVRNRHEFR